MNTFNTLRPRQNGRHFPDDIFKSIFFNENVWIPIKNSLKFIPQSPIKNIPTLVQIMACRRPEDNPLSGPKLLVTATLIQLKRFIPSQMFYHEFQIGKVITMCAHCANGLKTRSFSTCFNHDKMYVAPVVSKLSSISGIWHNYLRTCVYVYSAT